MSDTTEQRPTRRHSPLRDIFWIGVQALTLFLILSALIGRFEIHQISMEPTFHEGQRVVVSKLDSIWSNLFVGTAHAAEAHPASPFALHRGQIVVFYRTPDRSEDALIKRVIGLPGDTIEIRSGQVYVNGAAIDEPYVHGVATSCNAECGPITLDADSYFMMGDNRANSMDSRVFGPIPAGQVIGHVVLRYWPFNQIELFP